MNRFFQRVMIRLQQFVAGRYGRDSFSAFLNICGLIFAILGNFKALRFLYFVGLIMILYSSFRVLSKNFVARQKELNRFLRWSEKPKAEMKLMGNKIRDRKTHRYYKCKNCKTVMRVPKGRGKIEITCPRCRAKSIRKT